MFLSIPWKASEVKTPSRRIQNQGDATTDGIWPENASASAEPARFPAQMERAVQERTRDLAESFAAAQPTGELILSEQKERRRMAKILHDNLQQILVSIKIPDRVGETD